MNWRDHITVDPEICHGRACITGTRVLVTTILDNLAAGLDSKEIMRSYPSITRESIQAAVCYAAELAGARDPDLASACVREGRVIVTFNMDFSDIRTYPPGAYSGLVVFRLDSQAREHVLEIGTRFLGALSGGVLDGQLWIVEDSRIRVRE